MAQEGPRGDLGSLGTAEEQLELALEVGRLGTWSFGIPDLHMVSSDTCKANYGRGPRDEFSYEDLLASVIDQDRARWQKTLQDAVGCAGAFEIEYGIQWPDGSPHWVFVRGSCRLDAKGRIVGMLGVSADITEQKRAREKLEDAQARVKTTLAAAEVGTWTWDVAENRVIADRNLARLFGVTEADADGGPLDAYVSAIHPADRERVSAAIQLALARRERYEAKYRVLDAEGTYRSVIARGEAEYGPDGKPTRLPGVLIDITREERAGEQLRESQERFRSLFEAIDDGFCMMERVEITPGRPAEFVHIEANPAFFVQTGIEEAVVGKTIRDLVGDEADGWNEIFENVLSAGKSLRFERELAARGRCLELYALPVPNSQTPRVAVLFKDISWRKHAERALRATEERVRNVLSATGAGTWEADLDKGLFTSDGDLQAISAHPEKRSVSFDEACQAIHPEDVEHVKASIAGALAGKDRGRYFAEYRLPLADGQFRWIEARGLASFDDSGKVTRFAGTSVDVTARKQSEAEREELLARAQAARAEAETARAKIEYARVVERQLRREAEQANRAKDEFFWLLGQQLRTPLAPIATALQMMKLRPDDAFINERAMIGRQVEHLTRLVEDLLDVSRITSGKIALERRRVNVASVVASAIEIASPLIERGHHQLDLDVPAQGLMIEGDHARLTQVVAHLLSNAAKYTELAGGRISVRAERNGADILLRVKDEGVGIAPDVLPRVFDLFVQERQPTARAPVGLGLGLTIVRSLTELHGGVVSAFSAGRGQGAEFTVRLPEAPPSTAER